MKTAEARDTSGQLEQAIEGLRQKFLRDLDERIFAFEDAMAQIRNGSNTQHALRHIHAMAHKQAGIAPSLGFAQIGEISRDLEEKIEKTLSDPDCAEKHQAWHKSLELLLDEMEQQLPDLA